MASSRMTSEDLAALMARNPSVVVEERGKPMTVLETNKPLNFISVPKRKLGMAKPPETRAWKLAGYKSKLEMDFHAQLKEWGYPYCEYEPLRLKLANRAHYTPDFVCRTQAAERGCAQIIAYETKGFWREAARVRIKVAAKLYPWIQFFAVTRAKKKDGGAWQREEIKAGP